MIMNKWIRFDEAQWAANIEKVVDAAGRRVPYVRSVKCVSDGVYVKCIMKYKDKQGNSTTVLEAKNNNDVEDVVEFVGFIRGGKVIVK